MTIPIAGGNVAELFGQAFGPAAQGHDGPAFSGIAGSRFQAAPMAPAWAATELKSDDTEQQGEALGSTGRLIATMVRSDFADMSGRVGKTAGNDTVAPSDPTSAAPMPPAVLLLGSILVGVVVAGWHRATHAA